MNARRLDARRRQQGAGEFAFLGAPIGGVEHFGSGCKTVKLVEQLETGLALLRQALTGERHAQGVAAVFRHIDRVAAHFGRNVHSFKRAEDVAGRGGVEAAIEKSHARLGRHIHDRGKDNQRRGEHRHEDRLP